VLDTFDCMVDGIHEVVVRHAIRLSCFSLFIGYCVNINVSGIKCPLKIKYFERATVFFANQLLDPRTVRNLVVDVEIRSKLSVQGECVDEEGTRNPRFFTIALRSQRNVENMIKTLAHEMVHVKQHAKNELQTGFVVPSRGGLQVFSKWQGTVWRPKSKEDPYFDAPWEIEAYGREVGLYHKWVKYAG